MDPRAFVRVAKALADPTRLGILLDLRAAGEMTCSCVCARSRLTQPTISHHLGTLERAGLIAVRKDGPFRRISVREAQLRRFTRVLSGGAGAKNRTKRGTSGRARDSEH